MFTRHGLSPLAVLSLDVSDLSDALRAITTC